MARWAAKALIGCAYVSIPIAPALASLVFWRRRYVQNYGSTMHKTLRHIRAMRAGPALHYFQDVAGREKQVPEHVEGECIQCGNCCMHHQCMFLEPAGAQRFQVVGGFLRQRDTAIRLSADVIPVRAASPVPLSRDGFNRRPKRWERSWSIMSWRNR